MFSSQNWSEIGNMDFVFHICFVELKIHGILIIRELEISIHFGMAILVSPAIRNRK